MPELPEVEIFKRYLQATSLHKTIKRVEVKAPEILYNLTSKKLKRILKGQSFESADRYGKFLFVKISNGPWMTLHFGMTGRLRYFKGMEKDPTYDRLLIHFVNGYRLAYDCKRKFGKISLIEDIDEFIENKDLGQDALNVDFNNFKEVIKARKGSIKSILINQNVVAGIGNIYSDEILFQTGIHPRTEARNLYNEYIKKLFRKMRYVLQSAIEFQSNPKNFPNSYLVTHRFKDGKCPKDMNRLESIKINGRTSYYCPFHQRIILKR